MRFLHCSDVHVTLDYFKLPFLRLGWRRWIAMAELTVGGRAKRYLKASSTLSRIAADVDVHKVDHLIVSGDLTAYALDGEFKLARESLGEYAADPRRCTIIPGNHDVYTPGALEEHRFERHFGHLLVSDLPEYAKDGQFPVVRLLGEDVAVVGLRSARVPEVPGFSFGVIGRVQLELLGAVLEDHRVKHRAVLVVVHHAPLTRAGKKDKLLHGLMDADALFKLVRGPRFAVLHGHIHHRYHHPASERRPHLFGAGSSTEAGHEGYWVIEARDGQVIGGEPHRPTLLS